MQNRTEILEIGSNVTIREAMRALDKTAKKCLFVVEDTNHKLIGALTDGDVRRAILSGVGLDAHIDGYYNTSPLSVFYSPNMKNIASKLMKEKRVEAIPVVNQNGVLVDYISWEDIITENKPTDKSMKGITVVIMAGGFGTRLDPFTKVLPKPLIPINDKPIIEHIIDSFVEYGVNDFHLTVNYKSSILKAFFHDRDPDYKVRFIDEPEPMGTAGSLQFTKKSIENSFFVTNCDIIIETDYAEILRFHREQKNAITLVGSTIHHQIPYGTCILNNSGLLERIEEKPSYDLIINTGMYLLEPKVLNYIPETGKYHMTYLIEKIIDEGFNVGVFPISEDAWIDVGQWKEYKKATEKLGLSNENRGYWVR